jgi:hypothetical protein
LPMPAAPPVISATFPNNLIFCSIWNMQSWVFDS